MKVLDWSASRGGDFDLWFEVLASANDVIRQMEPKPGRARAWVPRQWVRSRA